MKFPYVPARADRVRRAPLRTIDEMAEEFKLTKFQLVQRMRTSSVPPPKPQFRHRGHLSQAHTWYEARAMRQWKNQDDAARAAAQPAPVG